MITQDVCKLKISMEDAENKVAFDNIGSSYDGIKSEFVFNINTSDQDNFKLIHDSKKAFAIIKGAIDTTTSTIYTIEEFETEKLAMDRIKELNLDYIGEL
jgi:hypothetical protein